MGSEFEIFGGFGWVRSSVSASEPGFERVRSSTSRVRSSLEFVNFGFDPTLGKTNFGSVQHRISSWISHLSGRQACPLHGKTNFRSNISIMQNLIELLHLLHFYCNKNSIMQMLGVYHRNKLLLWLMYVITLFKISGYISRNLNIYPEKSNYPPG